MGTSGARARTLARTAGITCPLSMVSRRKTVMLPTRSFARYGMKSCSRISSRIPRYFVSSTTPTTSMSVGVPGSVPRPRRPPMGFRPAKCRRAKVSLMITAAGAK
jgi:hypothetical protein